ncbi:MAG: ArsR family transcriptional regulator [Alphaproteobacteria bacterium]|nr:MAG: ArsR family transcriptional regulator [Alphaproteobacteria bacterium]
MNIDDLQNSAQNAAQLLSSLANEKRLMLLCQLVQGERSVGDLVETLGLNQSNVSQQLAILRKDGLVKARREGQNIYYSLKGQEAQLVIEVLHRIYCCAPA